MKLQTFLILVLAFVSSGLSATVGQETNGFKKIHPKSDYDPLKITKPSQEKIVTKDLTVVDNRRNREIPLRVYLPAGDGKNHPVVLFSHGLGGAKTNNPYLGNHWSERGYVVVFMQHIGSDESVWKNKRVGQMMSAMKKAASGENYLLRVEDVRRVIDQLEDWNQLEKHALQDRIDVERIGMSGHSFGARTTQAVGGQWAPVIGQKHTDKRIKAAVAMSPSPPNQGDVSKAFGSVAIPWMLMTGTHDESRITRQKAEARRKAYPGLPKSINKYELVLHNAEHSAFSERKLAGDQIKRNPNHHKAILALSTAFWDAHLKEDKSALMWLHGDGAKSILEPNDIWQSHKSDQQASNEK